MIWLKSFFLLFTLYILFIQCLCPLVFFTFLRSVSLSSGLLHLSPVSVCLLQSSSPSLISPLTEHLSLCPAGQFPFWANPVQPELILQIWLVQFRTRFSLVDGRIGEKRISCYHVVKLKNKNKQRQSLFVLKSQFIEFIFFEKYCICFCINDYSYNLNASEEWSLFIVKSNIQIYSVIYRDAGTEEWKYNVCVL